MLFLLILWAMDVTSGEISVPAWAYCVLVPSVLITVLITLALDD